MKMNTEKIKATSEDYDYLEGTEIFNQIKKHLEIYFATAEDSPTKDKHIEQITIICSRLSEYVEMLQRVIEHYELSALLEIEK